MGKKHLPKVAVQGLTAQDIRNVMKTEFDHYLSDIEFRVAQAYEVNRRPANAMALGLSDREIEQYSQHTPVLTQGRVYAEDMATNQHMITGYTTTAQSPAVGQMAWASLHIVYGGVDYAFTDGNCATTDYYLWFNKSLAPAPVGGVSSANLMQKNIATNKPVLATGDVIIFLNNAGVPVSVLEQNIPRVLADNAVDTGSLQANAVTGAKVGTGANGLTGSNLTPGANIAGTQLSATAGIVGTQMSGTANIAGTQLSPTANLVGSQLTAGTIGSTQIGTGAVNASRLSILEHVIY